MRVLHLINAFNPGGVERWLLSMMAQIPREECAMDVCCKGEDPGPWAPLAQSLGATIHHCPLRFSHVTFVKGLSRVLRTGCYDLVHNHLGLYSGCGTWVARREGVPVLVTFHNTEFRPSARCFRFRVLRQLRALYGRVSIAYAVRASNLVTTVSQGVSDSVLPRNPKIRAKARIMFHGVDLPKLPDHGQKAAFRRSLGWNADVPVIVHVGKFTEQKNHMGVLEVFCRVLERVREAKLVLIGAGPLRNLVDEYRETHGLEDSVRLLGVCDNALCTVSLCDVFLFPSLFEGFGLAALEANAAGLPVVGTRIPGLLDAVEDRRTALLHEVDDVEGMADSVVRLITDPAYARVVGDAGRARAQTFSRSNSAEQLLELYRECLTAASRHRGVR